MRVYIIGNDGIILCREPPAAVNEGEIVVASNEELHAAQLSGKRLLALWNALPDVEKRKKVGDRDALIDQLWSAVEALPDPDQPSDTKPPSKRRAWVGSPVGAGPVPTVTTLTLSSRRKATLFRIILWRCRATAEHENCSAQK